MHKILGNNKMRMEKERVREKVRVNVKERLEVGGGKNERARERIWLTIVAVFACIIVARNKYLLQLL